MLKTKKMHYALRFGALALCLLLLAPLLLSCTKSHIEEETFFALDTVVTVRVIGKDSKKALQATKEAVLASQAKYNAYDTQSELSHINAMAGQWTAVSAGMLRQLQIASELQTLLPNAFSPFLLEISERWDFVNAQKPIPSSQELAVLLQKIEGAAIQINSQTNQILIPTGTKLDLGGIAKGAIGYEICTLLDSFRLTGAYLSLGGNVQLYRNKADGENWKIGIADPFAPTQTIGVLETGACAIVTSGSYQRYRTDSDGTKYHHILNPTTAMPAQTDCASVTVVCSDGAWADALSTALFVAGLEQATTFWRTTNALSFEWIWVTQGGEIYVTQGLASAFTLSNPDKSFHIVNR